MPFTVELFADYLGRDLCRQLGRTRPNALEGLIRRHLTFVPLAGITIGPDSPQMPVSKANVRRAPNIELRGDELSKADDSTLYHHYELNYTPPDTERGRRLTRR